MREFTNPEDYFPYIGHDIDQEYMKRTRFYINIVGDIFNPKYHSFPDPDTLILDGSTTDSVFERVKVKGMAEQRRLAADNSSVELIVPRHRSLYDYTVGQPVHNRMINPNVLIIAGNNLFVGAFNTALRKYGGVMFLREDAVLKRKGLPKVFLTQKRYIDEVYPAYMKQQMFNGVGESRTKMDVILYAEQEKDPVTKKRSGGRSKTGKLRGLSLIFFDKLKGLTKESDTTLYVTPVNVSFSKYPEVPYIVHPIRSKGIGKALRYLQEQHFTFFAYTEYSHVHTEAKLNVTVHYGKPEVLRAADFTSTKDLLRYSHDLQNKIGLLETVYPLTLLYRAMENVPDISISELDERMKVLYTRYLERGIDMEPVSESPGKMMSASLIVEKGVRTINSNPDFRIAGVNRKRILTFSSGRIFSHDPALQAWYANSLHHLDNIEHFDNISDD